MRPKFNRDELITGIIASVIAAVLVTITSKVLGFKISYYLNATLPLKFFLIITVLSVVLYGLLRWLILKKKLFLKKSINRTISTPKRISRKSLYNTHRITDIIKADLSQKGMHLTGIQFGDRFHINDLKRMCTRVFFSDKKASFVESALEIARASAFSQKYVKPRDDEKLADISKLGISDLKPWEDYFQASLSNQGIRSIANLDTLIVGLGNGISEKTYLEKLNDFTAVDISEEALKIAADKYRQMRSYVNAAEDLGDITTNSIDLYISLRSYQSRLFDRRAALHEAYRVLRPGSVIIISIPNMYLQKDGTALLGLMRPKSEIPDEAYSLEIANRVKTYMEILNFNEVLLDTSSPYELYVSAKR